MSSLLWYEFFSSTLIKLGFQLNPYDACIVNVVIGVTQFAICWYVNDNKHSHADASAVTHMIAKTDLNLKN